MYFASVAEMVVEIMKSVVVLAAMAMVEKASGVVACPLNPCLRIASGNHSTTGFPAMQTVINYFDSENYERV